MNKRIRDYLFILFIIIFIVMTVVMSLYASGYKFNLSWPLKFNRLLQKTGMLVVATQPTRATIYLNDKPQKNLSLNPWKNDFLTTPAKIKNILPGEYILRLEEDGYWPFTEKIQIYSGESTFAEDINLFRADLPVMILTTPADNLSLSPDNKYLYLNAAKKIITLKTEAARTLTLSATGTSLWLKDGLLFAAGGIFDPAKETNDINYAGLVGSGVANWHLDETNGYFYYQNNNAINRLDPSTKTSSVIISGQNYLDFLPNRDQIFTLVENKNQIQLESYNLKTKQLSGVWTLAPSGHYIFKTDIPNYLSIYDDKNNTLYLFNPISIASGPLSIRNIKKWTAPDSSSLIYINDFEINIYNFQNNRTDLVTRLSEEIKDIIWNGNDNYLVYATSNTLNVLDFKNRNVTFLFRAEQIASPVLDSKNSYLYFWASIGQQAGIYKMLMQ
ncbi:MAG: hypothetical protein WC467_00760 [Patescibacteria group bacterium]